MTMPSGSLRQRCASPDAAVVARRPRHGEAGQRGMAADPAANHEANFRLDIV
jgi:hypothetical protein